MMICGLIYIDGLLTECVELISSLLLRFLANDWFNLEIESEADY